MELNSLVHRLLKIRVSEYHSGRLSPELQRDPLQVAPSRGLLDGFPPINRTGKADLGDAHVRSEERPRLPRASHELHDPRRKAGGSV